MRVAEEDSRIWHLKFFKLVAPNNIKKIEFTQKNSFIDPVKISGGRPGDVLAVGDLRRAGPLLHVPAVVRHQDADGQVDHGELSSFNLALLPAEESRSLSHAFA